mmetsp:Transcript_41722/g.98101  ORF Transcript_41722/g.98101 Transcript_41722/m.98101 type:complete len:226 (+) Transcript_41722:275-952(+)
MGRTTSTPNWCNSWRAIPMTPSPKCHTRKDSTSCTTLRVLWVAPPFSSRSSRRGSRPTRTWPSPPIASVPSLTRTSPERRRRTRSIPRQQSTRCQPRPWTRSTGRAGTPRLVCPSSRRRSTPPSPMLPSPLQRHGWRTRLQRLRRKETRRLGPPDSGCPSSPRCSTTRRKGLSSRQTPSNVSRPPTTSPRPVIPRFASGGSVFSFASDGQRSSPKLSSSQPNRVV